jgi:hypothetical protein
MKVRFLLNLMSSFLFLAIIPVAYFTDNGVNYAIFATIFLAVTNSFTNDR